MAGEGPSTDTMEATATPPDSTTTAPQPTAQGYIAAAREHMVQPETPTTDATIPEQNAKQQSPTVIQPVPHSGIRGVIDKALDSIAGTHGVQLATDQDGNMYLQHPNLSRGQQWMRIGMEALRGGAAGLAAGRGRGNGGKALMAGIQQGDQTAQQESDKEEKYKLQVANSQALAHETAAKQLQATREQVKFDRETHDYYAKQFESATAAGPNGEPGGTNLGTVQSLSELSSLMKENPDAIDQQVKHGDIRIIPNYEPDGQAAGFHAVLMPPGWGNNELPAGSEFYIAVPDPAHPGLMMRQKEQTSGPATARQIAAYNNAADNKILSAQMTKTKADEEARLKNMQAEAADRRATVAESEVGPLNAERNAQANAANARAEKAKTGEVNADGTPNATFDAMAQAVYNGDILPSDLKREAKGANLDPNAIMARAVQIGQANGKTWSAPIIEQEHNFAKNVKTQAALDGIDRIIAPGSGYMAQMMQTAKDANLGPVGAVNTMALAARRGYGEKTAKNLQTAIGEVRRSVAGLIGNPLLGGGETDKKLEAAMDLLGKAPTLENLDSANTLISNALGSQRQSMVGNNRFLLRRYGATPGAGGSSQQQAAPAGQPVKINPGETVADDGKGGFLVVRNGQWTPAVR